MSASHPCYIVLTENRSTTPRRLLAPWQLQTMTPWTRLAAWSYDFTTTTLASVASNVRLCPPRHDRLPLTSTSHPACTQPWRTPFLATNSSPVGIASLLPHRR